MVFAVAAILVSIGAGPAVAQAPERRIEVTAGDDYYQPNVAHVRVGDTIVFVNRGMQLHSSKLIDHEDLLDQAYVKPGQMVSFVVPDTLPPGTYTLGCNVHVDMTAKIVVDAGP
jgi:plastocyanin